MSKVFPPNNVLGPKVPDKTADKKVGGRHSPPMDLRFMSLAVQASWISKDPVEQIGAVIVSGDDVLAIGYNSKHAGILYEKDLSYSDEDKKLWMKTAGCAAIDQMIGVRNYHTFKIYLTSFPCLQTMHRIVQEKIMTVIYGPYVARWYNDEEFEEVKRLAKLATVSLTKFEGNLNWARDKWEAFNELP